jgi:CHAD domain-containing protein
MADTMNVKTLEAEILPVQGEDTMAEAGRKILLSDFVTMLKNEAGSRTGNDIENVHNMRVATRRLRSAFRLLGGYYKKKPVRPYTQQLKQIARLLGAVRDLDVMINDLNQACIAMDENTRAGFQNTLEKLDRKRQRARNRLVEYLDSDDYREFVAAFAKFLTRPGKGALPVDTADVSPHQVRHVLPTLLHEHLSIVRAYETNLEQADDEMLHALRIEFKRLRYALAYFKDVLGTSGKEFINEIKAIQDHLGRFNDITVAMDHLRGMIENDGIDSDALNQYIASLEEEKTQLREKFGAVWTRFNSRGVQSKLSNALLSLR